MKRQIQTAPAIVHFWACPDTARDRITRDVMVQFRDVGSKS